MLHTEPRDLLQQWEHPVLLRTGCVWNTLGTQQNSRAASAHTWSFFVSSSIIFFLSLAVLLFGAGGTSPTHVEFLMSEAAHSGSPSFPGRQESAQLYQELPTASWRAMSGNHGLSTTEQNLGEFSSGQCCHVHQWGTLRANVSGDKHNLNFSSEVSVSSVKPTVKYNYGLKRTFWK